MSLSGGRKSRETPLDLALADEFVSLNWAQLDALLNRATNALLESDAAPDGRIGVCGGNCVETAIAHLASLHAGLSSVPINSHLGDEEIAYILRDSATKVLFVGPETFEAGLAAARLAGVGAVVGWRCAPNCDLIAWEDWLARASDLEPPTSMPSRPHLHYTSGTTGRPKGTFTPPTMFPQSESVAALIDALTETQAAQPDRSPGLVVSPIYHTGPMGSIRALAGGQAQVILSRFDPEKVLQTIEAFRIKTTLMVPTHFQRLLALPEAVRRRYDLSSLVLVAHTGAACPRDVKQRMIDWLGPILVEAYGGSESGTTNLISSEDWLRKPGSVGRTLPTFEAVVVDDEGKRLGTDQVGQLYFRDMTGRGIVYHNDEAKTKSAHLEPGLFTLGEIGYVDEEGFVFITDRASDMIVSGGVNIYPAEAEQVLLSHPAVADVAVVGAPNDEMGEEVKALVVLKGSETPPTAEELAQFCRSKLAAFKCPRSYEFVDTVGRNAMGKVNKRALRSRFWPSERTIGG